MPSPRNAAAIAPLPARGGGGATAAVVHGGWRAFVESYSDTHVMRVEASAAEA